MPRQRRFDVRAVRIGDQADRRLKLAQKLERLRLQRRIAPIGRQSLGEGIGVEVHPQLTHCFAQGPRLDLKEVAELPVVTALQRREVTHTPPNAQLHGRKRHAGKRDDLRAHALHRRPVSGGKRAIHVQKNAVEL